MKSSRTATAIAALLLGASAASASNVSFEIGTYSESHNDTNAGISHSMQGDRIHIWVYPDLYEQFGVSIQPPIGTPLKRGSYYGAVRDQTGRAPGIDGYFGYSGCQETTGWFDIRQIEWDATGRLQTLDATIVHSCTWGAGAPPGMPVTVNVRYNSRPWHYQYSSSAGDPLGGGRRQVFAGYTSDMALVGTRSTGFQYAVSGNREEWLVDFTPPPGTTITAGTTYTTTQAGGPGLGRLHVGSRDHTCGTSTGSLTVHGLKANATTGKLSALNATYVLQCDGQPPLKGSIRHYL